MRDEQLLAYCRKFRFERKNRADGIRCNQEKKEAGHGYERRLYGAVCGECDENHRRGDQMKRCV